MYKALAYKEWLKIRWFYLGAAVIGTGVIIGIFLNLRVITEFNQASGVWSYVVFRQYLFYEGFRFIPLVMALAISATQYYHEISNQKLKLNLHLPMEENRMLLFLSGFSLSLMLLLDLYFVLLLIAAASVYFPFAIVESMLVTILPWFLAGFVLYIFVAVILIEPLWRRRILILTAGLIFANLYLISAGYSAYSSSFIWFILLTIIVINFVLISGNRFKLGVR